MIKWLRERIYGRHLARIRFLKDRATEAEKMRDRWRDETNFAQRESIDQLMDLNRRLTIENTKLMGEIGRRS